MGWIDHSLKLPNEGEWLVVLHVTSDGDVDLVDYLSDPPADLERDLGAVQQRWTLRATWPDDQVIQDGARIQEFHKYPEEHDG